MITASSVASQSELSNILMEYLLKRLTNSSQLAFSCDGPALLTWLSCVKVMVSIISLTATSCLGILDGVFSVFCKV